MVGKGNLVTIEIGIDGGLTYYPFCDTRENRINKKRIYCNQKYKET